MKYRVFFNPDCAMFGVQVWRANINYQGDPARWTQVLPPKPTYGARGGKSAYTRYEGVAKRWLKELEARSGYEIIEQPRLPEITKVTEDEDAIH